MNEVVEEESLKREVLPQTTHSLPRTPNFRLPAESSCHTALCPVLREPDHHNSISLLHISQVPLRSLLVAAAIVPAATAAATVAAAATAT